MMADYQRATGKTIREAFVAFHALNPHVYQRFKDIVFRLIERGRKRYSSKTILCVVRFQRDMETQSDEEYRINDAFTAEYARLFIVDFPQHKDFFEFRELRRHERPDFPEDDDGQLYFV